MLKNACTFSVCAICGQLRSAVANCNSLRLEESQEIASKKIHGWREARRPVGCRRFLAGGGDDDDGGDGEVLLVCQLCLDLVVEIDRQEAKLDSLFAALWERLRVPDGMGMGSMGMGMVQPPPLTPHAVTVGDCLGLPGVGRVDYQLFFGGGDGPGAGAGDGRKEPRSGPCDGQMPSQPSLIRALPALIPTAPPRPLFHSDCPSKSPALPFNNGLSFSPSASSVPPKFVIRKVPCDVDDDLASAKGGGKGNLQVDFVDVGGVCHRRSLIPGDVVGKNWDSSAPGDKVLPSSSSAVSSSFRVEAAAPVPLLPLPRKSASVAAADENAEDADCDEDQLQIVERDDRQTVDDRENDAMLLLRLGQERRNPPRTEGGTDLVRVSVDEIEGSLENPMHVDESSSSCGSSGATKTDHFGADVCWYGNGDESAGESSSAGESTDSGLAHSSPVSYSSSSSGSSPSSSSSSSSSSSRGLEDHVGGKLIRSADAKVRKRHQNKEAAFRYRLKKKAEMEKNEDILRAMETRNRDLKREYKHARGLLEGARMLYRKASFLHDADPLEKPETDVKRAAQQPVVRYCTLEELGLVAFKAEIH